MSPSPLQGTQATLHGSQMYICKAETDREVENKCVDTKGAGRWDELGDWD